MIRAGIAVVTVALSVLLAAAPAGAVAMEAPAFSIELSDGLDEARPGDRLEYVATVRNEGAAAAAVRVSVIAPPSLALHEAAGVDGDTASWDVELAAGERREFTVRGRVGDAVDGDYQIVTMATVARSDAPDAVIVRTADADAIPGVDGPPPVPGLEAASTTAWIPWAAGAVAAVLVIAAGGFGLWGMRLRRRAQT